jgi:hypothetical protein
MGALTLNALKGGAQNIAIGHQALVAVTTNSGNVG